MKLAFLSYFSALALAFCAYSLSAQSFGDLPKDQQAQVLQAAQQQQTAQVQEPISRTSWQQGTYGPVPELTKEKMAEITPFGADLFSGGFRGVRADGMNPSYKILPGDQVTLRVWGAVDIDRIMPVDAQGNIFIPTIGPVQVMGVSHSQLDTIVRAAVRRVYSDNVSVYTNLQGVQPVAVFVTGFVSKPGRYAGVPSDSVLYFLDQAAGIDNQLGSYRSVRIMRNKQTIAQLDLYDFLLTGQLPHDQLQNGDTILVEARGPVVTVHGDVGRPYHYELSQQKLFGNTLTALAQLNAGVSHVLLRGNRVQGPYASYLSLAEFALAEVANGDEIMFFADKRDNSIVVQLEGSYLGQSHFVLPKDASLHELLNSIAIDPYATDYQSVSVRRLSVAERQRQSLLDSLRRLETTYLGAPSATAEESAIRVREAELISQFVAKARQVKPTGRLVVAHEGEIVDLRLQDGDIITLPARSDAILVSGEIYVPQSVIFIKGKSAMDYITGAGGFSQHADKNRILVVRQNGEVRDAGDVALQPGDEILVLPKVSSKNVQLATSITQIMYQIAVATKVALDL
jgi:protein involved in polysaccharide export with SLBB domain